MTEEWRPVVGYEDRYEVSDRGRVRSLPRCLRWGARVLHGGRKQSGHLTVLLVQDSRHARKVVARLVLEAFVGPCPVGMEACHNDGNASNDTLNNLRWDTHLANIADKKIHGTQLRGDTHPNTQLSDADVDRIREMLLFGARQFQLIPLWGVSQSHMSSISRGRRRPLRIKEAA